MADYVIRFRDRIEKSIIEKLDSIGTVSEKSSKELGSLVSRALRTQKQLNSLAIESLRLDTAMSRYQQTAAKTKAIEDANAAALQKSAAALKHLTSMQRAQSAEFAKRAKDNDILRQQTLELKKVAAANVELRRDTAAANKESREQEVHFKRLKRESAQAATAVKKLAAAEQNLTRASRLATKAHYDALTAAQRRVKMYYDVTAAANRAALSELRLQRATDNTTKSMVRQGAQISSIIGRYAALAGVTMNAPAIIKAADSYTNLQNKLSTVTTSLGQVNTLIKELDGVATRSRTSMDDVTRAFTRFDLAAIQLGKSQAQTLAVTETINKSLILSGATTSEASSGLLQLSQAFNKGKLDGDEFRSVMELMPIAADAIAKEMKVTRGELLKLAPQGKITADIMFRAFERARKEVDEKFAKTMPTLGQALTVLANKAQLAWGKMTASTGMLSSVSRAVLAIADNMSTLLPLVVAAGSALATYFGIGLVGRIASATAQLKIFNGALAATSSTTLLPTIGAFFKGIATAAVSATAAVWGLVRALGAMTIGAAAKGIPAFVGSIKTGFTAATGAVVAFNAALRTIAISAAVRNFPAFFKGIGSAIKGATVAVFGFARGLTAMGASGAWAWLMRLPAMLAALVPTLLGVTKGVLALNLAMSTNVLAIFAAGIAAIVTLFLAFGDRVQVGSDKLVTLKDVTTASFKVMWRYVSEFFSMFNLSWEALRINTVAALQSVGKTFMDVISGLWRIVQPVLKAVVTGFELGFEAIVLVWNNLPIVFDAIMVSIVNMTANTAERMVRYFERGFENISEKIPGMKSFFGPIRPMEIPRMEKGYFSGKTPDELKLLVKGLVNQADPKAWDAAAKNISDSTYLLEQMLKGMSSDIYDQARRDARTRLAAEKTAPLRGTGVNQTGLGTSSGAGSGKTKKASEMRSDEAYLRAQFVKGMESLLGKGVTANQCAVEVRRGAEVKGLDLGITKNPLDYGMTKHMPQGPGYANSLAGSDITRFVKPGEAKAGDLVFFQNTDPKYLQGVITHVAVISKVFADGTKEIIHASSGLKKVTRAKLEQAFRPDQILAYGTPRRLLNERGGVGKDTKSEEIKKQEEFLKLEEKYTKALMIKRFELANEFAELRRLAPERERLAEINKIEEDFMRKGLVLKAKDRAELEKLIPLLIERRRIQAHMDELYAETNQQLNDLDLRLRANRQLFEDGNRSMEDYLVTKQNLNKEIERLMDPLTEFRDAIQQENKLLRMNRREREIEARVLEQVTAAKLRKLDVDEKAIRKMVEENEILRQQTELRDRLLDESVGGRNQASSEINAIAELLKEGNSGFTQGDAATKVAEILSGLGLNTDFFSEQLTANENRYAQHIAVLDQLKAKGLLSEQTYQKAILQFENEKQEKWLASASDFFGNLASLQQTNNKKMFEVGKAAAIAGALIDTYKAANSALSSMPGPLGIAAAAAAIVAGMVNVNKIRSQQMSGYMSGGYTGNSARNQVAGVVHGQEFVMNAAATQRIGVGNLYALQNGANIQGNVQGQAPLSAPQVNVSPNVNVPVNVVAVGSREEALSALRGREGETIILDAIKNNRSTISKTLA